MTKHFNVLFDFWNSQFRVMAGMTMMITVNQRRGNGSPAVCVTGGDNSNPIRRFHNNRRMPAVVLLVTSLVVVVGCLVSNLHSLYDLNTSPTLFRYGPSYDILTGMDVPEKTTVTKKKTKRTSRSRKPTYGNGTATTTTTNTLPHVAACLLVMDDNHLLVEWLAYHYHAVNLRTLIIATDPRSVTSPREVLDRYRGGDYQQNQNHYFNHTNTNNFGPLPKLMTIFEWTADDDYMTDEEFKQSQRYIRSFHDGGTDTTTNANANATTNSTPTNAAAIIIGETLVQHRARQRVFYTKCLQALKRRQWHDQTIIETAEVDIDFVMLIDTDEYLTINVPALVRRHVPVPPPIPQQQQPPVGLDPPRGFSLRRPGVVAELMASELQYDDEDENDEDDENGSGGANGNNEAISSSSNVSSSSNSSNAASAVVAMTRKPLRHSPQQASPCIQIPRLRFSAKESPLGRVQTGVPPSLHDVSKDLLTLRYRWHARPDDVKQNRISKAIIHLKRVPLSVLEDEKNMMGSIHAPLPDGMCTKEGLKLPWIESLFQIHHYLGSYEQYVFGRTNDARKDDVVAAANARTKSQFDRIQQEMKQPLWECPTIRPWLAGFVDITIPRLVQSMTRDGGIGIVPGGNQNDVVSSSLARALLQGAGVLHGSGEGADGMAAMTNTATPTTTTTAAQSINGNVTSITLSRRREQDEERLKSHQQPQTPVPNKELKILIFLTTIYSNNHIKYFDCCWPRLMQDSQLLKHSHIMIFSNNETAVPQSHLDAARRNFHKTHKGSGGGDGGIGDGPSLTFQFASLEEIATTKVSRPSSPSSSSSNQSTKSLLREDQWSEYEFQKGANLGLELGFQKGWFVGYDWIVRINPDVLIRNSTWLLQTMADPDVDGIFVRCGDKNLFQLHTDFFAVRPGRLVELWNSTTPSSSSSNQHPQEPSIPFSVMAAHPAGKSKNLVNHELTASKYFTPILNETRYRYLPDADPSLTKCRVRGPHASVYHQHDSVGQCTKKKKVCTALQGWTVT